MRKITTNGNIDQVMGGKNKIEKKKIEKKGNNLVIYVFIRMLMCCEMWKFIRIPETWVKMESYCKKWKFQRQETWIKIGVARKGERNEKENYSFETNFFFLKKKKKKKEKR